MTARTREDGCFAHTVVVLGRREGGKGAGRRRGARTLELFTLNLRDDVRDDARANAKCRTRTAGGLVDLPPRAAGRSENRIHAETTTTTIATG